VILANARIYQAIDTARPNVTEEALREVAAAETWSRNSLAVLVAACRARMVAALLYDRLGQSERAAVERRGADAAGQRLEAFYPSVLALMTRLVQLDEAGEREEARGKALEWAADIPELRAHCVLLLWMHGDSRSAYEAFQRWPENLARHDIGLLLGHFSRLDFPEAKEEAASLRDRILSDQPSFLSLLINGYIAVTLQDGVSKAQTFARAFQPEDRKKIGAFGPHYERLLAFACGELSGDDFLDRSGDSQFLLSEAHFLVGLNHLASNERPRALAHFAASIETGCIDHWLRHYARGILHRLRENPEWPPTIPVRLR
jgi:hypothetical protein